MNQDDKNHFQDAYSLEDADQTLKHYKNWAESYDEEIGKQNGYAQPARTAEALLKHGLGGNARILDAGCGSGLSGVALHDAGYSTIDGCDFSPEMLEKAADKGVYGRLWNADLNVGQPDIPDSSYDAVVAVGIYSFGHLEPDSCDDLIRIVRPRGLFVIALNEPYWDSSTLPQKLSALESDGKIEMLSKEYGDHLPGHNVMGWVITMRKT